MCNGNVLGDIRDHCNALLDVLVQKIRANWEYRIRPARKTSVTVNKIGTKAMKQIGNDQSVAEAPKQAGFSTTPSAGTKDKCPREQPRYFKKLKKPAVQPKDGGHQSPRLPPRSKPHRATTGGFQTSLKHSAEGCHRAVNGNNYCT